MQNQLFLYRYIFNFQLEIIIKLIVPSNHYTNQDVDRKTRFESFRKIKYSVKKEIKKILSFDKKKKTSSN